MRTTMYKILRKTSPRKVVRIIIFACFTYLMTTTYLLDMELNHRRLCGKNGKTTTTPTTLAKDSRKGRGLFQAIGRFLFEETSCMTVPYPDDNAGRDDDLYYLEEESVFAIYPSEDDHVADGSKEPENGTIAYAITITTCPEGDEQPQYDNQFDGICNFYETCALSKHGVCDNTAVPDDEGPAGGLFPYTMYAFIHPDAIICTRADGTVYDRVPMLQDLGYWVEILGETVTDYDIRDTQPYLKDHIQGDVGIRDTIKFNLWKLTSHPIVIMMDLNSLFLKPMEDIYDSFLNDNESKALYTKNVPRDGNPRGGVNTGFLVIKPSEDEFQNLKETYINATYDEVTGWNGQGHNGFVGEMGLNGFLSYYYSIHPAVELDRCIFSNEFDPSCEGTDFDQVRVARYSPDICQNSCLCPQEDGSVEVICQDVHRAFFNYRHDFETNHWNKPRKQQRFGQYRYRSFLGYCEQPDEYLKMVDVKPKPDWIIVCPTIEECPPGTYMKNDCTCTTPEDPCAACPSNTRCQLEPVLMCISCDCGFCNYGLESCCSFNGVNNCKSNTNDNECLLQFDQFAAYEGEGNACSGVEISMTATPNGCGCQPNELTPCTFDENAKTDDEKCFLCTSTDLVGGENGNCPDCYNCLSECASCISSAGSANDFEKCLSSKPFRDATACRVACDPVCRKGEYYVY